MTQDKPSQLTPEARPSIEEMDARQKAVAFGLEFTKRCFDAPDLEELFLLLTNDIRLLIQFDRSLLVLHIGGDSKFVSAANQPLLETKTKFNQIVKDLSSCLRNVKKGLLLAGREGIAGLPEEDLPSEAAVALDSYLRFTGASYLLVVPLIHQHNTVAHLMLEFLGDEPPLRISALTTLNLAPLFAAAIEEKWLLERKPTLKTLIDPVSSTELKQKKQRRRIISAVGLTLFVLFILFVVPVPFDVGGEAEVVAKDRFVAFSMLDAMVKRVNVMEGSHVTKEQVLATLDSRELDYRISSAQAQFDILTREMTLLRDSSGDDPAKLAESKLVELKRNAVAEELDFYKWHMQFLDIKAPTDGIILTRDIERLAGKKFRAGEPFCEIVAPGDLSIDVFVPDDRISYVSVGLPVTAFLAANPRLGYELTVKEINPIAETMPRLGNIYRVRAPFPNAPSSTMVGMKGTAKIHVKSSNIWDIAADRILSRWQRFSIAF